MTAQPAMTSVHVGLEATLQNDVRWFSDHPDRQFRMRVATPNDALQHESLEDVRWVIVPRPQGGLYVRHHAVTHGVLPDGDDVYAAAWLQSHPHQRCVYAIVDLENMRLFQFGPPAAAAAHP